MSGSVGLSASSAIRARLTEELDKSEQSVRNGYHILPRLRMFDSCGDHTMFIILPENRKDRRRNFDYLRHLLAWRLAWCAIISIERPMVRSFAGRPNRRVPSEIVSIATTKDDCFGLSKRFCHGDGISSGRISFGPSQRLTRDLVEKEIRDLIPLRKAVLRGDTISALLRFHSKLTAPQASEIN